MSMSMWESDSRAAADTVALGRPTTGAAELAAVAEVLASGWLSGAGPACHRFEERFAAVTGTSAALATSSCGAALHLALSVLGAGPGDEVVVADYTFPATGHAVVWTGATPVFADVRADVWTADPDAVAAAIGPRTVGIVAVDAFGQPADHDELRALADRHGLWTVEDAACAAGAEYRRRPAGSLADVATFSFHGRKGITAGEGGALTSGRADLVERARKLHTYGIAPAIARSDAELVVPEFDEAGHNYRLSDVAAAIMGVQLDRLPDLLAARRRVAAAYGALLGGLEQLALPVELPDRRTAWQSYVVTLDPALDRGAVAAALRAAGVQCTFGTYACHRQPVYGSAAHCPVSAHLADHQLAVPMHADLTDAQVSRVAETLTAAVSDKESART
ncbi:MAG TPA: DegT/DnrJ/EryC1/StrS family aminotransferase [Pseudonocardia sp.]|nr:DegT/DnrJ/EryC1/StrS family aminotransferase [Pseudonocardia sp.]